MQRLFSSETTLAISALSEVEFASAVAWLVRIKNISALDGRRVLDEFRSHIAQKLYVLRSITPEALAQAGVWLGTFRTALRTLDALQLAVAHSGGWPLVTADKGLVEAAGELGVSVQKI